MGPGGCCTDGGEWYKRVAQKTALMEGTRKQDANFHDPRGGGGSDLDNLLQMDGYVLHRAYQERMQGAHIGSDHSRAG